MNAKICDKLKYDLEGKNPPENMKTTPKEDARGVECYTPFRETFAKNKKASLMIKKYEQTKKPGENDLWGLWTYIYREIMSIDETSAFFNDVINYVTIVMDENQYKDMDSTTAMDEMQVKLQELFADKKWGHDYHILVQQLITELRKDKSRAM